MINKNNYIRINLILFVSTLLDSSIPVLGINTYVFLTPFIVLYLVADPKKSISPFVILPYLIVLDIQETWTFFGFYTLFFILSIIILDYLKKIIPHYILCFVFYALMYFIFFYLNNLSFSVARFFVTFVVFSIMWLALHFINPLMFFKPSNYG